MTTAIPHTTFQKNPEPYLQGDVPLSKNAFCPYYNECLRTAVEAGWHQFTCTNCDWRRVQMPVRPEPCEMDGYYRLLAKIFAPGR